MNSSISTNTKHLKKALEYFIESEVLDYSYFSGTKVVLNPDKYIEDPNNTSQYFILQIHVHDEHVKNIELSVELDEKIVNYIQYLDESEPNENPNIEDFKDKFYGYWGVHYNVFVYLYEDLWQNCTDTDCTKYLWMSILDWPAPKS